MSNGQRESGQPTQAEVNASAFAGLLETFITMNPDSWITYRHSGTEVNILIRTSSQTRLESLTREILNLVGSFDASVVQPDESDKKSLAVQYGSTWATFVDCQF